MRVDPRGDQVVDRRPGVPGESCILELETGFGPFEDLRGVKNSLKTGFEPGKLASGSLKRPGARGFLRGLGSKPRN